MATGVSGGMWVEMLVDLVLRQVNRGAHGLGPDIRQDQGGSESGWKVPESPLKRGRDGALGGWPGGLRIEWQSELFVSAGDPAVWRWDFQFWLRLGLSSVLSYASSVTQMRGEHLKDEGEGGADGLAQRWGGPGVGCGAAVAPLSPHSKLGASPVFGKMPFEISQS